VLSAILVCLQFGIACCFGVLRFTGERGTSQSRTMYLGLERGTRFVRLVFAANSHELAAQLSFDFPEPLLAARN
jgi:hypothetical protein